ncbi:Soluble starch synthase 3, chloroplastic/amyloplastic [Vitis vinifera]|uniref:starch synthase n=1 Tax=Vitis vinifera TaxID=29760 RepID=A0A438JGQ1_VITVI|nr:Soluble starch synthase 3, chloroplastic/amyloplastic [Vitis vinifera]
MNIRVWESLLEGVPSFHSESPNPSQFAPLSCPHPCRHQSSQPSTTNVPSPRRKRQELDHGSQSTCGQYIDSNSSLPEENIGSQHNTRGIKISEWKKAVQDEIDALEKNGTWTITDLPVGKRPVGCKWIFTIKYKADGSVERFKARLVARGFTQSYGIDYQETFAPVAKLNTIRILLSLAVNQDWCLQQLDIKNAFLNGDLEEEVYMEIPPGFEESMAKNQADHTLFVKKSRAGKMAILIVYVDDIILSGNDMEELQNLKEGIVVSQRKYILDLLKETGGDINGLSGGLIYLSHTRPDIGFAVSVVSQFMHSPTEEHMEAVYRILRYLKMTPGKGLFFRKTENRDTEPESSAEAEYRALAQGICSYKHSKEPRGIMTGPSMLRLTDTSSQEVKVPLDAYMMDFVFSEREDGGIFDNRNGMDYHIPVFGSVVKEPPMHIVHIAVEMAPIAKFWPPAMINKKEMLLLRDMGGASVYCSMSGRPCDVVTSLSRAVQELNHHVDIILPKYDCLNLSNIYILWQCGAYRAQVKDFQYKRCYFWGGTEIKVWLESGRPFCLLFRASKWLTTSLNHPLIGSLFPSMFFTCLMTWFGASVVQHCMAHINACPNHDENPWLYMFSEFSVPPPSLPFGSYAFETIEILCCELFGGSQQLLPEVAYMGVGMTGKDLVSFVMLPLNFCSKVISSPSVDIIHCHDWSSAPVSWLFKDHYKHYGLSKARVVFTIHNLEFGAPLIAKAMVYTDKATTVSHTYSREVSGNPAIAPHLYKFHGILNGIDLDIWDPYNDKFIPVPYTSDNVVEGKRAAKEALQQRLGLKKSDFPLVGIITRLTHQKGIHLIKHAIWRTLERNGQVVLLGSAPDPRIQNDFVNLANQLHSSHGDRARLCLTYDEPLSHLIYAGADFILVPSIFEPCGLTQLTAMRYGSIPVVRKTGGLYDTVFDVDHDKERAQAQGLEPNGFNFDGADSVGVDYALNRAISAWYDGRDWFNSLCKQVMEQDWSWNRPALDYMELYHAARK